MEEPIMIYRITISNKGKNYKIFNTVEEAVTYLHNWVESDGNHLFVEETKNGYDLPTLKWLEWADNKPRFITKSVTVGNPEEWRAYKTWQRTEREKARMTEILKRRNEAFEKAVRDYKKYTEERELEGKYVFKWKE